MPLAPLHCLAQVNRAGVNHQLVLRLRPKRDVSVPRLAHPLADQKQAASV
jgi:hypothetical protein